MLTPGRRILTRPQHLISIPPLTLQSTSRLTVEGMRIAELAEASGVPASTLRFYENAGLLPAERDANGYRRFGPEAVERLAFIGTAKRFGLPLEEIAEVVEVWADQACSAVRDELRPRVAARLAAARKQADESKEFADRLEEALTQWETMPDRESRCAADCCEMPASPPDAGAKERWHTAPITCALAPDALPGRQQAWRRALHDAVRTPLPDGLRLTVPASRTAELLDLATAEQTCCAFFDFRFQLDGPVTHLEVRAPAAGLQMLTELFA